MLIFLLLTIPPVSQRLLFHVNVYELFRNGTLTFKIVVKITFLIGTHKLFIIILLRTVLVN